MSLSLSRAVRGTCRAIRFGLLAVAVTACQPLPLREPPDFVPIVERAAPSVVGIADSTGVIGSGFRVLPSQLIVTAAHVVANARGDLRVRWQGHDYPVSLLKTSATPDLAVLRLTQAPEIPGLALADAGSSPRAGAWVLVLGCPFGAGVTATAGILSAVPGAVLEPAVLRDRFQINAAVNPGNSGGPVIDLRGQVIGVANATIPGGYGLGFAIPADAARSLLDQVGREH